MKKIVLLIIAILSTPIYCNFESELRNGLRIMQNLPRTDKILLCGTCLVAVYVASDLFCLQEKRACADRCCHSCFARMEKCIDLCLRPKRAPILKEMHRD